MLYLAIAMSLSELDLSKSEIQLICEYCDTRFESNYLLTEHLKTHRVVPKKVYFYCNSCKLHFRNKGLLACHMAKKHNINNNTKIVNNYTVKKSPEPTKSCCGCNKKFRYKCQLEYHIRKTHYNLISKQPYFNLQDINQTWYEKVCNTNMYAELKKFDKNTLFIRKVEDLKVTPLDVPKDVIDLRMQYPTESSKKWFPCVVCSKIFVGKDLSAHVTESHSVMKKMCIKCNCWFKPLTKELKHVCPM